MGRSHCLAPGEGGERQCAALAARPVSRGQHR